RSQRAVSRARPGSRSGPTTSKATVATTTSSQKLTSNIGKIRPVTGYGGSGLLFVARLYFSLDHLALVLALPGGRRFLFAHGVAKALDGAPQVFADRSQPARSKQEGDDGEDDEELPDTDTHRILRN